MLNKKVGGYRCEWAGFRQAYVRVYDPRGFEFEITVPNLLYILENTSSIKGKGLEGAFVYGWDGKDLVLVPTCSTDYDALRTINNLRFRGSSISAKDLKIGATYLTKDNAEVVYMGRFDYYECGYKCGDKWFRSHRKMWKYAQENNFMKPYNERSSYQTPVYEYLDGTDHKRHFFFERGEGRFMAVKSLSGFLVDTISVNPAEDYAELFEKLECKTMYSPIDKSKDEQVELTPRKILERMNQWGVRVNTITSTGEVERIDIRPDADTGLYTCSFYSDFRQNRMAKIFTFTNDGPYPKMIPTTLENICNQFNFFGVRQYLANGKFYQEVW